MRTDASTQIGTGHVMRCLTLAERLRTRGAKVRFVMRKLSGDCRDLVARSGFEVQSLPEPLSGMPKGRLPHAAWLGVTPAVDARDFRTAVDKGGGVDWAIVDHYALDADWELEARSVARKILAIDDLADRPHDCDLLLDQNLHTNERERYAGLVPAGCRVFLGPEHALLREEFVAARKENRHRDGTVRRVLVFFGGADPLNVTGKALAAIAALNRPDIAVDVVVGGANPNRAAIEAECGRMPNARFHFQVSDIARLMVTADLALGGGGTATWERCFLGLPCMTVVMADNQEDLTRAVTDRGAGWQGGKAETVTAENLKGLLGGLLSDPKAVRDAGEAAIKLMGNAPDRALDDAILGSAL